MENDIPRKWNPEAVGVFILVYDKPDFRRDKESHYEARHQWLTPVFLVSQEAEIRITVRSQPGEIVCGTLS
jgi:hypothetical protein